MNLGQFIGELTMYGEIRHEQRWKRHGYVVPSASVTCHIEPGTRPNRGLPLRIFELLDGLEEKVTLSAIQIADRLKVERSEHALYPVYVSLRTLRQRKQITRHGTRGSYRYSRYEGPKA